MVAKLRKKRVPELKYTKVRGIGWHVSFRDPKTGVPRKHRFEATNRADADKEYHEWVVLFLKGQLPDRPKQRESSKPRLKFSASDTDLKEIAAKILDGSLVRHPARACKSFCVSRHEGYELVSSGMRSS
jgi:hypothetical protein